MEFDAVRGTWRWRFSLWNGALVSYEKHFSIYSGVLWPVGVCFVSNCV